MFGGTDEMIMDKIGMSILIILMFGPFMLLMAWDENRKYKKYYTRPWLAPVIIVLIMMCLLFGAVWWCEIA